jgi:hypothetical protein
VQQQGSGQPIPSQREKLEDRYKAIAIPALAAALGVGRAASGQAGESQMSAQAPSGQKAGGQS